MSLNKLDRRFKTPHSHRSQSNKTNQLDKEAESILHDQGINHFVLSFLLLYIYIYIYYSNEDLILGLISFLAHKQLILKSSLLCGYASFFFFCQLFLVFCVSLGINSIV